MSLRKKIVDENQIYFYFEHVGNEFIIGVRGGPEYRIPRWDLQRKMDSMQMKLGRDLTPREALALASEIIRIESEYVDFEPVVEIKGLL